MWLVREMVAKLGRWVHVEVRRNMGGYVGLKRRCLSYIGRMTAQLLSEFFRQVCKEVGD